MALSNTTDPLVRRSSKIVDKATTQRAVWRRRTAPDPGMGAAIELARRHARGEGDLGAISETLAGVGGAAEEAPPPFDEIEPSGPDGNKNLLNTRMGGAPLADAATRVTREVVDDEIEFAIWIVAIDGAEQIEIPQRVARASGLGADLSITDAQRAIDPGVVVAAAVDEEGFDPMAICRPARSRREGARSYRPQLVDAEDRRALRRNGVEGDDLRPVGAKSGSVLVAHSRVRRQRTPSANRIRRT
jgi:hypothetical protein